MHLQHLRISPEYVSYSDLLSDLCLSVDSKVLSCIGCSDASHSLVVRQDFPLRLVWRNNSSTLSTSRTRVKYGNLQKKGLV